MPKLRTVCVALCRYGSVDTWASQCAPEQEPASPWWLFFFRKRKRKESDEIDMTVDESPPRRVSFSHALNEGLDALNEGLESIASIDSITDLVTFPPKGEYSRCRINSEDSAGGNTALTSAISDIGSSTGGSPTSTAKSSTTDSPP